MLISDREDQHLKKRNRRNQLNLLIWVSLSIIQTHSSFAKPTPDMGDTSNDCLKIVSGNTVSIIQPDPNFTPILTLVSPTTGHVQFDLHQNGDHLNAMIFSLDYETMFGGPCIKDLESSTDKIVVYRSTHVKTDPIELTPKPIWSLEVNEKGIGQLHLSPSIRRDLRINSVLVELSIQKP